MADPRFWHIVITKKLSGDKQNTNASKKITSLVVMLRSKKFFFILGCS
jgi:hypothetical protein